MVNLKQLEKKLQQKAFPTGSDWKQLPNSYEWYKPLEKYSYIKVWKTGLPLKEMKRRGYDGTYIMAGRIGRYEHEVKKVFKTKLQAIAYAKKYMRTH